MESKIIGLDEANRMLPLLRSIVEDIMAHWEDIIAKRSELECLEKGLDPAGGGEAPKNPDAAQRLKFELNYLIDKINHYIREVEELGCFVEEFKRGIVNFPSLHNGRKVFLCWQPSEPTIAHWHELDETFGDRVEIRDASEFLVQNPQVR
ncbi:MAG: DUF2203 domain-containing protein [Planctomycetota bacterium]